MRNGGLFVVGPGWDELLWLFGAMGFKGETLSISKGSKLGVQLLLLMSSGALLSVGVVIVMSEFRAVCKCVVGAIIVVGG